MIIDTKDYLAHHGIAGQKWGVRRYQNEDGSLTPEGREHYGYSMNERGAKKLVKDINLSAKQRWSTKTENLGSSMQKDHAESLSVLRNKSASAEDKEKAMNDILKDPRMSKIADNAKVVKGRTAAQVATLGGGAGLSVAGSTLLMTANANTFFPGPQAILGAALNAAGGLAVGAGSAMTIGNTFANISRNKIKEDK